MEPAFNAEWVRVAKSGTLADFLKLKESKVAGQLVSLTPPRHVMDVCVDEALGPWLAVAETGATSVRAVPGGWVRLELYVEFDVPGHNRQVTYTVSPSVLSPELPAFVAGDYQMSILRGFKGPKKKEVSGAQISRFVWVNIPADAAAKEIELTLSAAATGPRDGVVATEAARRTVVVNLVADVKPTRGNLFSLWLRATDAGEWLASYPNGDAALKAENEHWVAWGREWFTRFAADPQLAESALVKELMAEGRWVKFVTRNPGTPAASPAMTAGPQGAVAPTTPLPSPSAPSASSAPPQPSARRFRAPRRRVNGQRRRSYAHAARELLDVRCGVCAGRAFPSYRPRRGPPVRDVLNGHRRPRREPPAG